MGGNVTQYIHHVPGRLRIKSRALKGKQSSTQEVIRCLNSMDGIVRSQVNPVTGSMLVFYNPQMVAVEPILDVLKEHGLVATPDATAQMRSAKGEKLSGYGDMVLKAIAGAVVEKVAERSAVALIGAIL